MCTKLGALKIIFERGCVLIFRWESDTAGSLSLYSTGTCLKLERPALEMHILWCITRICSWISLLKLP